MIHRHEEYEAAFNGIENLLRRARLNERMAVPLFNASLGIRVTNSRYQKEAEVSSHVAGRDLKVLTDLELLLPHGEKRGRYYTAGRGLIEVRARARRPKALVDPYTLPEIS